MQLKGDLETKILSGFHFKSDRSKDRGTEWSRNLLYLSSCHLVEKIKETLGDLMLQTMGPLPLFGAEYLILYFAAPPTTKYICHLVRHIEAEF